MWQSIGLATARTARVRCATVGRFVAASRVAAGAPTAAPLTVSPSLRFRAPIARAFASATTKKTATKSTKSAASGGKRKASTATKKPAAKAAKPKPKAKPRKVLTEEEKRKVVIKGLKKLALLSEEPSRSLLNPWSLFVAQEKKGKKGEAHVLIDRALADDFKSLSLSEREKLEEQARKQHEASGAAYQEWLESHTPAEIANANRARTRLRSLGASTRKNIKDERIPKKPGGAFIYFVTARMGDRNGEPVQEMMKDLGVEWKAMSESDKQPFIKVAEAAAANYATAVKTVLGREVRRRSPSPTA